MTRTSGEKCSHYPPSTGPFNSFQYIHVYVVVDCCNREKDRFASMIPKVIPASTALVQSAQYLSSEIPARASRRLELLKSYKRMPGMERLIERYETLASCPYPGYAHGQLRDMDPETAVGFGVWMEEGLRSLEQVCE